VANTCYNLLTVTGPAKKVARFVRKARGRRQCYPGQPAAEPGTAVEELCFHALHPVPPEILRSGYYPAGHD
jgi:hypothetical protein